MTEHIEGYTGLTETKMAGRTVYALSGLGKRHAYFSAGSLTIWVEAEPSAFQAVLQALLSKFSVK